MCILSLSLERIYLFSLSLSQVHPGSPGDLPPPTQGGCLPVSLAPTPYSLLLHLAQTPCTPCFWGDAPSTVGRSKLYFVQPLSSIFSSFNKSYFNNKNIFILRTQFHNIFQGSICSEISKTQTHASRCHGPDQFNSWRYITLCSWLVCLLGICGVRD